MPYSRFNLNCDKIKQLRDEDYSYAKYKRKRAYHNESFKDHFLKNLQDYNEAIFDNNQKNEAHNDDVFNLVDKLSVDIIYLDPPYTGTMNNYFEAYDFNNGLLLSKNMDILFDQGYITFKKSGKVVCSSRLNSDLVKHLKNYTLPRVFLSECRLKYLKYHRKNIFKKVL